MKNSRVEWTDRTFNPWTGPRNERKRTSDRYWKMPLQWNVAAREFERLHDRRQRVFCASSADVFDNKVPAEWRIDLFALIRECQNLDWMLLTKRPQNICKMLPKDWRPFNPYPNLWLGVTAEDQTRYDKRWRKLALLPATVRFVSYEPAIGPLELGRLGPYPDWLICGGESGGSARPIKPKWIRDIIAECRARDVTPFHKQWGSYRNNPIVSEQGMSTAEAKRLDPHGKGGGLVDGKLVREFPTPHVR